MKQKYFYNGPVMAFGQIVDEKWWGETTAVSEEKARSNLAYRWKKQHGRTAETKITLPGKLLAG